MKNLTRSSDDILLDISSSDILLYSFFCFSSENTKTNIIAMSSNNEIQTPTTSSNMMEQTSVASSSSSQTSPTDKKAKVWIDKLEDLQICESYCHVSFNSEEGTKKSGKEFWTQVCNHFMKNIVHKQCTLVDRTWDSLKARWLSHIQKNVSKFAGCLTKCIKKNASGSNIGFDVSKVHPVVTALV